MSQKKEQDTYRLNVFGPLRKDQVLALVGQLLDSKTQFSCIEHDGSYTLSHPIAVAEKTPA